MSSSRVNDFLDYTAKSEWAKLEDAIQSLTDKPTDKPDDKSIVKQLLTNNVLEPLQERKNLEYRSLKLGVTKELRTKLHPTFLDCLLMYYNGHYYKNDESTRKSIGSCITLLIQKAPSSVLRKALSQEKTNLATIINLLDQPYSPCEPLYKSLFDRFLNTSPEEFHNYDPGVLKGIKKALKEYSIKEEYKCELNEKDKCELDAIISLGEQPYKITIQLIDKAIKISNRFIPENNKQEASARFWLPILDTMLEVINASAPNHPSKNIVHAFLGRLYFFYPYIKGENQSKKEEYKHYKAITSSLSDEYAFDNLRIHDFYRNIYIEEKKRNRTASSNYSLLKGLACLYSAADQKNEKQKEHALGLAYPTAISILNPGSGQVRFTEEAPQQDDDKINTIRMGMTELSKTVAQEGMEEYKKHLIKLEKGTKSWFCFFRYSVEDLKEKEKIFSILKNNEKSLYEKIQVAEQALKNPCIIGESYQECASILKKLQYAYTIETRAKTLNNSIL